MWLVAAVYVLTISEFFYYHYYLAVIPAIFICLYFLKLYPHHQVSLVLLVITVLIIYCAVCATCSVGLAGKGYGFLDEQQQTAALILTAHPDLLTQPSTLYLDDGLASYYFPTQSACRYVGALPIQRNAPDWDTTTTKEYWEQLNCSLNYTGKYVIVNPTFMNISYHTTLKHKLDTEYNITVGHVWDLYSRS